MVFLKHCIQNLKNSASKINLNRTNTDLYSTCWPFWKPGEKKLDYVKICKIDLKLVISQGVSEDFPHQENFPVIFSQVSEDEPRFYKKALFVWHFGRSTFLKRTISIQENFTIENVLLDPDSNLIDFCFSIRNVRFPRKHKYGTKIHFTTWSFFWKVF